MPRPWRKTFPGAKYHITSRGNGRKKIFYAEEDTERMIEQLTQSLEREGVILYAYALMPNHYHLLVETPQPNLCGFMQRLNTAYAMYFRHKRQRPGHCFQGRYGAKLVEGDDYILRLTRYIHLNPIKLEAMRDKSGDEKLHYLETYRWSSYQGYVSKSHQEGFINYRWLRLMNRKTEAGNRMAYTRYVHGFVIQDDRVMDEAYGKSAYAIGNDEFVEGVEREILAEKPSVERRTDFHWPAEKRTSIEQVMKKVAEEYRVSESDLRKHGRAVGVAKGMAIELACLVCGISQREVGRLLGLSEHGISKQRKRLALYLEEDEMLAKRLDHMLDLLRAP